MKKSVSLIIAFLLVISFAGCSASTSGAADSTVKGFLDAAKEYDFTKMLAYISPGKTGDLTAVSSKISNDPTEKYFTDYLKTQASKINYQIKSSNVSGDSATVSVECKYIDATPFIQAVVSEYLKEAMPMASSGTKLTDDQTASMMKTIISNQTKSVADTDTNATIDIKCVRLNGKWYIDTVDESLANAITSNAIAAGKAITYETVSKSK